MLEIIIIINFLILVIHIIILYKNNKINIFRIEDFKKVKGGHYIDRKIRNYTILPFINRMAISIHDGMHWLFRYGEIKENNEVKNTLTNEIKDRLKKNDYYNKILNNSYVTNETRVHLRNKISKNKSLIKNILSDII